METNIGHSTQAEIGPGTAAGEFHYLPGNAPEITPAGKMNRRLVSLLKPNSYEAERYRRLRHQVEGLPSREGGLVLGITSPIAGDGKTLTSINLAGALSQNPAARVLLVELDLRQPQINLRDYLGIGKEQLETGLVEKIGNPHHSGNPVYTLGHYNLDFMPCGQATEAPYEILKSPRLGELLTEARQRYDFVILDTPPVVVLPDSQLVSRWVDGFLVVVGADHTPRDMLEEALNEMSPEKVVGLVFNGHAPSSEKYYRYGYHK